MFILDIVETCGNPALRAFLVTLKNILLVIQILVPAALLISCTIEFTRLSINPEDKKGFRKILNKIIAAFIVVAIPFLVNLVMSVVGESEFSNCWKEAHYGIAPAETYIEETEEETN